jgi:hypothetical protein
MLSYPRIAFIALCCVLIPVSKAAIADYGEAFLSVRCDQKSGIFEVEPLIIWNEELLALEPKIKSGNGRVRRGFQVLLHVETKNKKKKLEERCNIAENHLKVLIPDAFQHNIELYSDQKLIAAFAAHGLWNYGYVFRVRYMAEKGWEVLCGWEEAENSWFALDGKRVKKKCHVSIAPN